MRSAFTLVELSIVLVIIGLLTGGILAGQSLIHAAEIRSVTSDFMRYQAAVHSFRDKYMAIPGDMANAEVFWGKDATGCGGTAASGTCNGNGDGMMTQAAGPNVTGERFQFWRQLALAGVIEGSYSGLAGTPALDSITPGVNAPKSKLANAAWNVYTLNSWQGSPLGFAGDYGNYISVAAWSAGASAALLKPEDMWNIDTKMDDGKPATGRVMTFFWPTCTNATGQGDTTSIYNLTSSAIACAPLFLKAF